MAQPEEREEIAPQPIWSRFVSPSHARLIFQRHDGPCPRRRDQAGGGGSKRYPLPRIVVNSDGSRGRSSLLRRYRT